MIGVVQKIKDEHNWAKYGNGKSDKSGRELDNTNVVSFWGKREKAQIRTVTKPWKIVLEIFSIS